MYAAKEVRLDHFVSFLKPPPWLSVVACAKHLLGKCGGAFGPLVVLETIPNILEMVIGTAE